MASARQVAANSRNARLPRGPLSAEAGAAISQNAMKHGLTAKHVVLQHEDYADYHELRASITMEYQPLTPQEHRYADQIAQNYWRLLRCRRIETATFENRLTTLKNRLGIDPKPQIDNDEGISICMANEGRDFDTLRRYETTIERAWYRAIRQLKAAQKERREYEAAQHLENRTNEPNPQQDGGTPFRAARPGAAAPVPGQLSDIGIGCVSQNDFTPDPPPATSSESNVAPSAQEPTSVSHTSKPVL